MNLLRNVANQVPKVIVIEHNLDVIKTADWIIDIGPEGGDAGGKIVGVGTPETLSNKQKSHTGLYLKEVLTLRKQIELGYQHETFQ